MNPDDYERAILGAILAGWRGLPDLARDLAPEDFYQPAHEAIYRAALRVYNAGGSPDPLTVRTALGQDANRLPNGPAYLAELIGDAGPSVHHYATQVKKAAVNRRLRDLAAQIDQLAQHDADPDELIAEAGAKLDALSTERTNSGARLIGQVVPTVVDIAQTGRTRGLSTPWPDLDRLLRGLHAGRLYVIGARPGIGKSLFGQNCATHFALRHGVTVYVASLEMSDDEFTQRALASLARVDLGRIDTGGLDERDWSRLSDAVAKLGDAKILINDDPGQTLTDIRAGAQDAARRHNLGLIVVDYLQLVRSEDRRAPREQQVADISRRLKRLARELKVPVIALAQVNRGAKSRSDGRPSMEDLRESGAIEADADAVILLHTDTDVPHLVEAAVPKNRSGPKGRAELLIFGHYASLESQTTETA
jgi:replicative DNA helicase